MVCKLLQERITFRVVFFGLIWSSEYEVPLNTYDRQLPLYVSMHLSTDALSDNSSEFVDLSTSCGTEGIWRTGMRDSSCLRIDRITDTLSVVRSYPRRAALYRALQPKSDRADKKDWIARRNCGFKKGISRDEEGHIKLRQRRPSDNERQKRYTVFQ